MKKYLLLIIGIGALFYISLGTSPAKAVNRPGHCEELSIPVAITEGGLQDSFIRGTLCTPLSTPGTSKLDILIHGLTYDRTYWDNAYADNKYSYVNQTLQQGRATFAFDRIGSGQSTRSLGLQVTLAANAYTTHQVVQWLKTNRQFSDISLIGHSFGSGVAIEESARYNDVSRVVNTGLIHTINTTGSIELIVAFTPALLDPAFIGKVFDPTYLTTRQGTRSVFYNMQTAEPGIISYDEQHKGLVSDREVSDIVAAVALPPLLNNSTKIRVPVLTVMGDQDKLFCDKFVSCSSDVELQKFEAPFYPNAASFTAHTIPNTGHSLTLHPSHQRSFQLIDNWIKSR